MAAEDTMWFELGVRDNVSKTLSSLMEKTEDLKDAMKSIQLAKGIFENALKIEQAYDKIAVALRKIEEAKSLTKDREQLSTLRKSEKKLKDIRTKFEEAAASEDFLAMKGTSAFTEIANGLKLAVTQVDRYTKTIDEQSRAEERHKNEELRRVDELKAKYYELQRYREKFSAAVSKAAPGVDTSDASSILGSLAGKMSAVTRAQANGGGMPSSATGADFDKFISHVKDRMRELTSETDAYNTAIAKNESITRSLNQNLAENISKRNIADIKGQQAEYDALTKRIGEIQDLIRRVQEERAKMETQGVSYKPNYTQERVSEELATIQRRYNEELARNQQEERKTADAKKTHEAAVKNMINANRDLISIYNRVEEAGKRNNTILEQMKNQMMGFAGLYGIERLLKNVIQIGGEFEVQHIALQSILGDVQQANSMFEQMKELAVVSPFNFRQLAAYTKQVAAFGIPYEEMYDTTKRLADMAAGLGVDMGRLILAYGQVRSAAVLRGQELRQFTEAGIPLVQELAKEFTKLNGRAVSTAEVFELISKRAVPFEMVKKIMWDMTNEGGRFFDMQFVLSDTLAGKWSNLRDAWEIMLSEFAKGESMTGKFLKGMVTLTTKILESMNILMPLLGGGLLFVGLKRLNDFKETMGMKGINANIAKTQQLYYLEMKRKLVGQEITREQYNEAIARSRNKDIIKLQLAQEGKLKAYQIQKIMLAKQYTNEQLRQAVEANKITMREAAQVRLWRMKYGQMSAARVAMMDMVNGVGKFMKSNLYLIAFDVAVTALLAWKSHADEVRAKNQELKKSFEDAGKSLKESYDAIDKGDINEGDYKSAIEGLKELVKEHSNNYDAIMLHANGIKDLKEQYEYLKSVLKEEQVVTEMAQRRAEDFGSATRRSFEAAKNAARDYIRSTNSKFKLKGSDEAAELTLDQIVKNLKEKIERQIPDINSSEMSKELYRKLRDAMEEEKGFTGDERMLINIKLNELFKIDNVEDATTLVVGAFGDIISHAEQEIANKIKYGSDLKEAEQNKVAELVNDAINQTKDRYPAYAQTLQSLLDNSNFVANIQLRWAQSQKVNEIQSHIYNHAPFYLDENTKAIATAWGTSGNWTKTMEASTATLNEQAKDIQTLQTLVDGGLIETKKLDDAVKLYDDTRAIAVSSLNNKADPLHDKKGVGGKKGGRGGGGTKKDTALEILKSQINEYKKFYAELKNAQELYGKQGGIDWLKANGFEEVFGWGLSDMSDFGKSLNELTKDFNFNTKAREELKRSIDADKVSEKRKKDTEATKEYISELQKMISIMADNYETYKKWLDLSGDANLAAKVAGVAENTTLSGYLSDQMSDALKKAKLDISPADVFAMKESDVKNLGEQFGIQTLWDQWQKNQSKIKKEQWDLYEEAYKGAKNYDDKIADINRDLEKHLEAVDALARTDEERERLSRNLRKNAERSISSINWDKFKEENNWGAVFGDLGNVPLKSIKKMVKAMRDYANVGKMDVAETKAWYEGMTKLTDRTAVLDPLGGIVEALKNYEAVTRNTASLGEKLSGWRKGYYRDEFESEQEIRDMIERSLQTEVTLRNLIAKSMKEFATTLNDLSSSLQSLGSSIGGRFGDVFNGLSSIFGGIGKSIDSISSVDLEKKGIAGLANKVGAVATVISAMIDMNKGLAKILPSNESLYEHYAAKQREINKVKEAMDSYAVSVAKANEAEGEWFAGSNLSKLKSSGEKAKAVIKAYNDTLLAPQEIYREKGGMWKKAIIPVAAAASAVVAAFTLGAATPGLAAAWGAALTAAGTVAGTVAGAAVAAGVGYAIGQAVQAGVTAFTYKEGQTDARSNMKMRTRHRSFWRGEKTQNLEEWTRENLNAELFDRNGLVNLEAAQEILDKYGDKLVGETKATLEKLVELRKQYDEFVEDIRNYVGDIGSGLADSMTNAIWDWLAEGKDAVTQFKEYASDTFKSLAQDIVKTFMKVAVLDKYSELLENIFMSWSLGGISDESLISQVGAVSGMIAQDFSAAMPLAQQLATLLNDTFGEYGYDITGKRKNSSSASSSIKGISENTADLLASYVNAIRADTSVNRTTLSMILVEIQRNGSLSTIANAQLEQLRSISANTYATSVNTAAIAEIYAILRANTLGANQFNVK